MVHPRKTVAQSKFSLIKYTKNHLISDEQEESEDQATSVLLELKDHIVHVTSTSKKKPIETSKETKLSLNRIQKKYAKKLTLLQLPLQKRMKEIKSQSPVKKHVN